MKGNEMKKKFNWLNFFGIEWVEWNEWLTASFIKKSKLFFNYGVMGYEFGPQSTHLIQSHSIPFIYLWKERQQSLSFVCWGSEANNFFFSLLNSTKREERPAIAPRATRAEGRKVNQWSSILLNECVELHLIDFFSSPPVNPINKWKIFSLLMDEGRQGGQLSSIEW